MFEINVQPHPRLISASLSYVVYFPSYCILFARDWEITPRLVAMGKLGDPLKLSLSAPPPRKSSSNKKLRINVNNMASS